MVGLFSLLNRTVKFLWWFFAAFLRPAKDLKAAYGSWAIVTGATDGIGKAIAFELASKGLHLVLVGRNPEKLERVAADIRSKNSDTEVKHVVMDLACDDVAEGLRMLRELTEELDVGVLVNNAGTTYPGATYFHELDETLRRATVAVNVEATTRITRAVVPRMWAKEKGAIVNIGSAASTALPSFPLYDVYAATKAFVDQLSKSLNVEYGARGIDVQCQIPFYVATKMVSIKKVPLFTPTPERYARAAVRRIGYEARCSPYMPHVVLWFMLSLLPDFVLNSWRLWVGEYKRSLFRSSSALCTA